MSEEEIIKNLEERYVCDKYVGGILDLYQNAKKETEGIYADYQDLGKDYYKLQEELEKNYISKDKMRKKISLIKELDILTVLQDLLEE